VHINQLTEGKRFDPYVGTYTSGGGRRTDELAAFQLVKMKFRFGLLFLSAHFALLCSGKCFNSDLLVDKAFRCSFCHNR